MVHKLITRIGSLGLGYSTIYNKVFQLGAKPIIYNFFFDSIL